MNKVGILTNWETQMKALKLGSLEEAEIMHPIYEEQAKKISHKLKGVSNIDYMEMRELYKQEAHEEITIKLESMGYTSIANHSDVLANYTREA
jgi:hypothetical protein